MPLSSKPLYLFSLMGCALVCCALLLGCGGGDEFSTAGNLYPASEKNFTLAMAEYAGKEQAAPAENSADAVSGKSAPRKRRKIIYTATISLVVDDLLAFAAQIGRLAAKHEGYLADSAVDSTQGDYRTGRWQARVPADRFQDFLESISQLGVAESRRQSANDVTEEYVDLTARIAAKKKLEERILELLANTAGKIQEILIVEQELARVRSEIESMEGRMRFLQDQTTMTTVTISAREERNYSPPQAPSFANRVAQTWAFSIESVQVFFAALALLLVACSPWLVVLGAPSVVLALLVQRKLRQQRQLLDI